jgi:hypothetical protein
VNEIIFKMVGEEFRLLNNYKNYRRLNLGPYVEITCIRFCRKFFIFALNTKKLFCNGLRTEFPIN